MKVQVVRGNVSDPGEVFKCAHCRGAGKSETYFQSGSWRVCSRCNGNGINPSPHTYTYEVGDPKVGDLVELPQSWVPGSRGAVGTVVSLESQYTGPVKRARKVT